MTENLPDIPAGISHEPDFASMSPDERRKEGTKFLSAQAKQGGWPAVRAAKERHPVLDCLTVKLTAYAHDKAPPGYGDAVGRIIGGWLTEPGAVDRTNAEDVAALNANFGGQRYNPANHFSRDASKSIINRAKELFRARGFTLPETANTLSKIKRAAKAARVGTLPSSTAFGSVGTVTDNTLLIGNAAYRIENRDDHPSIRLSAPGTRQYVRLDVLEKFMQDTGLQGGNTGEPSSSLLLKREVEMALTPVPAATPPLGQDILPETWRSPSLTGGPSDPSTEEPALNGQASLSDRIARLSWKPTRPTAAEMFPGIDPLELTDEQLATLRA